MFIDFDDNNATPLLDWVTKLTRVANFLTLETEWQYNHGIKVFHTKLEIKGFPI